MKPLIYINGILQAADAGKVLDEAYTILVIDPGKCADVLSNNIFRVDVILYEWDDIEKRYGPVRYRNQEQFRFDDGEWYCRLVKV